MAFNLLKAVGGSKLLLLPFTGVVVGGTGLCYATYKVTRSGKETEEETEKEERQEGEGERHTEMR